MVKVLLISDNNDPSMGPYFAKCAVHAKQILEDKVYDLHELLEQPLNSTHMDHVVKKFNSSRFLCIVYSHGSKVSFISQEEFIGMNDVHRFNRSFFYTFSCNTGADIGAELVKSGCITFWGYNSDAGFIVGYLDLFVECANFGIHKMIGGETAGDAFNLMKENYTEKYYSLYKSDFIVASLLMSNKDAMVLHGERDVKLDEFSIG